MDQVSVSSQESGASGQGIGSADTHVGTDALLYPQTFEATLGVKLLPKVGPGSAGTDREGTKRANEPADVDVFNNTGDRLSVLYLFAGVPRVGDVRFYMEKEAKKRETTLALKEIDFRRRRRRGTNLLRGAARAKVLADIRRGCYHVVLASPPCSTFSRAHRRDDKGPNPLRSQRYPRGFPWLGPRAKKSVTDANTLIDFIAKALKLQAAQGAYFWKIQNILAVQSKRGQRVSGHGPASLTCCRYKT